MAPIANYWYDYIVIAIKFHERESNVQQYSNVADTVSTASRIVVIIKEDILILAESEDGAIKDM